MAERRRTAAHWGLPFVPNRASMPLVMLVSGTLPDNECGGSGHRQL
jgi:hypothetical protein